jgi:hypothetical protein
MAPIRKPQSRTVPAKTGANHRSAKPRSVKAKVSRVKPTSIELLTELPGLLIVGIGASDGVLEAMEEVTARQGEGSARLSETCNLKLGHSRQRRSNG